MLTFSFFSVGRRWFGNFRPKYFLKRRVSAFQWCAWILGRVNIKEVTLARSGQPFRNEMKIHTNMSSGTGIWQLCYTVELDDVSIFVVGQKNVEN